jgi:hypothetical protein
MKKKNTESFINLTVFRNGPSLKINKLYIKYAILKVLNLIKKLQFCSIPGLCIFAMPGWVISTQK